MFARARKKARCAVETIAIAQGHGWHLKAGGPFGQLLRQACGSQKTEGAAAMKFNILSHIRPQ
jgi:hypothetical protein